MHYNKCSTVQKSRVQYRGAEYSTEEQSTVQKSRVGHVVPLYMNYSTVQYRTIQTFMYLNKLLF